jgi:hypothetical protein
LTLQYSFYGNIHYSTVIKKKKLINPKGANAPFSLDKQSSEMQKGGFSLFFIPGYPGQTGGKETLLAK